MKQKGKKEENYAKDCKVTLLDKRTLYASPTNRKVTEFVLPFTQMMYTSQESVGSVKDSENKTKMYISYKRYC